jgi:hypothetical protein
MPKGSVRKPTTSKTAKKQAPGFRDDRYELSRTIISPKGRTGAFYDPELYSANRAAAKREKAIESAVKKSPRGGSGMENPVKALKRRATTKKK